MAQVKQDVEEPVQVAHGWEQGSQVLSGEAYVPGKQFATQPESVSKPNLQEHYPRESSMAPVGQLFWQTPARGDKAGSKQEEQLVALVQVLHPRPQSLQFLFASMKKPFPHDSTQEDPKRAKPAAQFMQLRRDPEQPSQVLSQTTHELPLAKVPKGQLLIQLPK